MTIDMALEEWSSRNRQMGCVAAAKWFCSRVPGFEPLRLTRWTEDGEVFQHVVAVHGHVQIDIASYNDGPAD